MLLNTKTKRKEQEITGTTTKYKLTSADCLVFALKLTWQDGWKTQDGRMTKKCRASLGMHSLARHFFVILPSSVLQPSCYLSSLVMSHTTSYPTPKREKSPQNRSRNFHEEANKIHVIQLYQAGGPSGSPLRRASFLPVFDCI